MYKRFKLTVYNLVQINPVEPGMASVKVLRNRKYLETLYIIKALSSQNVKLLSHFYRFLPQACSQDEFFSSQGVNLKRPSTASGC